MCCDVWEVKKSLAALKCKGHNGDFLLAIGTRYINPLTQNHSSLLLDQTDPLLKDEKKKKKIVKERRWLLSILNFLELGESGWETGIYVPQNTERKVTYLFEKIFRGFSLLSGFLKVHNTGSEIPGMKLLCPVSFKIFKVK